MSTATLTTAARAQRVPHQDLIPFILRLCRCLFKVPLIQLWIPVKIPPFAANSVFLASFLISAVLLTRWIILS